MRAVALFLLCTLIGCAAIPAEDQALLLEAPDCSRSTDQIAALEKIKPNGLKRAQIATQYLSPTGLINGAIREDFADRTRIINGDYGREVDARIALVRAACDGFVPVS